MLGKQLKTIVLVGSAVLTAAGGIGMVLSFIFMASADPRDITAGSSGFAAGALFVCTSLIATAIVSLQCCEPESSGTTDG